MLALEFLHEVVDHSVVEILATQVSIASCCLHLKDALLNREQRDVKGTAAKVKNENVALGSPLLVETVRDRSGCGLVDDPQHIEASNCTSVLGCCTLRIIEVGRHGDDGILDLLAKIGLGGFLHLGENHR
mmetsp:Transcript_14915/g.45589  ORF Transcript_14915/g.45589 Transcript_14915/m.45589 type:complete len:130 (-) Transcript_14915:296-685(-)